MKKSKYFIFFLIVLSEVCTLKRELSTVDMLREMLINMGDKIDKEMPDSSSNNPAKDKTYLKIVKMYLAFDKTINEYFGSTNFEAKLRSLDGVWLWARTEPDVKSINGLYELFTRMSNQAVQGNVVFSTQQWIDFSKTILTDPNVSIPTLLDRIARLIVDQKLFFSAYQEAATKMCEAQQSPQQLLYNLYNVIALAEIKGFAMMQFSWELLRLYGKGNFANEITKHKEEYKIRISETLKAVKTAMAFAPADLWKCDPKKHVEGKTYVELKQLFQGYIVNEVDLNSEGTCRETCGYYSYAKIHGCYKNLYCAEQRQCNGKLVNCQYVDSDMWVCPSESKDRRYQYIQYENGLVYGKNQGCRKGTRKVDSWWRWVFWHCSYCMCTCDDHNASSHRYFSLRSITSDVDNNKVITGLRMKLANKIVHIQIQEGTLLPQGNIDENSVAWKPIDNFTIQDDGVVNGRDYHTIAWEKRALDLDDLKSPQNHLLTGIRFRVVGSRLNLEIRTTPFNFTTGEVMKQNEKSYWHSNDNTEREQLEIKNADVPTASNMVMEPNSKPNQYLNFAPSDLKKDAGQSTIPFLDIQPIVPNPPVPIAGAGIFHKGKIGYGGYVALKLITYDFAPHLHANYVTETPLVHARNL